MILILTKEKQPLPAHTYINLNFSRCS